MKIKLNDQVEVGLDCSNFIVERLIYGIEMRNIYTYSLQKGQETLLHKRLLMGNNRPANDISIIASQRQSHILLYCLKQKNSQTFIHLHISIIAVSYNYINFFI